MVGEPEKSLLVRAIGYTDEELKMPPKRHLSAEVAARSPSGSPEERSGRRSDVKKPAGQGRHHGRHWAFQRIKAAIPPR